MISAAEALSFLSAFDCPAVSAFLCRRPARRSTSVLFGAVLDVDCDPILREHLAEKAARLRFLGAVNDFYAGQGGGRARARRLGLPLGTFPSEGS